jgi:hypothetical protein
MNHKECLTKAIMLALTARNDRYADAMKLVDELAELCTPNEISEAYEYASNVYPKLEDK